MTDLPRFRCQKSQYFLLVKLMQSCGHVTVEISTHREKELGLCKAAEIKHTNIYQGLISVIKINSVILCFLLLISNKMHQ